MLMLVFLSLVPELGFSYECHFEDHNELGHDRSGSFTSDLWYWPHHRVYFRYLTQDSCL